MKKVISIVFIIVMCFGLCACDPGTHAIDPDSLKDVISIDLIAYTNESQAHFSSWVPNHFDDLIPFEVDNATVLETLPTDKIPDFLSDFQQTNILHTYYAYNSPKDVCIRLNYENGHFLIIWANYKENQFSGYIGEYSADGEVVDFWGCFSNLTYYEELVNQYFDFSI